MRFRRVSALVDAGDLRPAPMTKFGDPPTDLEVAIVTERGRGRRVLASDFLEDYEPADGDAQAWADGLRQRLAERERAGDVFHQFQSAIGELIKKTRENGL